MKKLAGVLLALALAGPAAAQDANAEFFARNAQAPGVKTIPGIQYKVLKSGPETGAHPKRSSTIKVRYEGKFLDGRVFDSSKNDPDGAVTFPLGKLIPGWVTVLPLMRIPLWVTTPATRSPSMTRSSQACWKIFRFG